MAPSFDALTIRLASARKVRLVMRSVCPDNTAMFWPHFSGSFGQLSICQRRINLSAAADMSSLPSEEKVSASTGYSGPFRVVSAEMQPGSAVLQSLTCQS